MIDTHCHLNDIQYADDVKSVVANFLSAGVEQAICVGSDENSSIKAKQIAQQFNQVYFTIGVHPDEVHNFNAQNIENLIKASLNQKLVAIGEVGLDYFHNKENKEEQIAAFSAQIELANKYHLPIVIHCRDAYGDCLQVLKKYVPFKYGAVMHCYSGSWEYAKELLKLNIYLSFTGTVTFKNAVNVKEVATNVPLDKFFVETDSPYLSPEPHRGERNEPKNVMLVADYIAQLKGLTRQQIDEITTKNAKEFFKIK